jgi:hypothetical protein
MDNKVGDNVPTQQQLDALYAKLSDAITELAKFCITLSEEERTSRLHPLKGAEPMVEKAGDLCQRYNVSVPGAPADGMLNDLHLSRVVRPFITLLQSGAQMAEDTLGESQAEYWQAFLSNYGAINTASAHNPALAAEAKELIEFMRAYRNKRKRHAAEKPAPEAPKAP